MKRKNKRSLILLRREERLDRNLLMKFWN